MELYFGGLEFQYIGIICFVFEINYFIYYYFCLNICVMIGCLCGNYEKVEELKKVLEQVRVVIVDFVVYVVKLYDFFLKEFVIGFNVEDYL